MLTLKAHSSLKNFEQEIEDCLLEKESIEEFTKEILEDDINKIMQD